MHGFQSTQKLLEQLEEILRIELYLVGGAVRSLLLGKATKDFDFTTPTHPDEVAARVKEAGYKPLLMGKRFGTVGFKMQDELIEITTFRGESYTTGSRKPEVSYHGDIKEDLARRDFTINAMALAKNGDLIDFFDGQADLRSKIIRCVGDPRQRFSEDPLRMLRAVRFAGQYEFNIEKGTKQGIISNATKLLLISKERMVSEVDLILSSPNVGYALDLLLDTGLLAVVVPEMSAMLLPVWFQEYRLNLWQDTLAKLSQLGSGHLEIRWAIFMAYLPDMVVLATLIHQQGLPAHAQKVYDEYVEFKNSPDYLLLQAAVVEKNCHYLKFSRARTTIILDFLKNQRAFT